MHYEHRRADDHWWQRTITATDAQWLRLSGRDGSSPHDTWSKLLDYRERSVIPLPTLVLRPSSPSMREARNRPIQMMISRRIARLWGRGNWYNSAVYTCGAARSLTFDSCLFTYRHWLSQPCFNKP